MKTFAFLLVLLAACGEASGPGGLDPIVLAKNQQGTTQPVSITWWDQSGQVQATTLPAFSETCVQFITTKVTDSVRFVIVVGDTTGANGAWVMSWSPWFDPKTGVTGAAIGEYPHGAEFWTATIDVGPTILMKVDSSPPC